MSLETISAFEIKAFCEVPHLYQTNRLWRDFDHEQFKIENYDGKVILCSGKELDLDFINFNNSGFKKNNDTVLLTGLNKHPRYESTAFSTIPIVLENENKRSEEDLIKDLKDDLNRLAEEFDVEIIVTNDLIYGRKKYHMDNIVLYINILGLNSKVQKCELHTTILVKLFQSKISQNPLFVESLDVDSESLLPACIGVDMTNIKHLASVYKTDIHIPTLLNTDDNDSYLPQVFFTSKVHALASEAKHEMSIFINKTMENIYYRNFTSISPGKLLFIRQYYQEEIFQLMVKYSTFIKVSENGVEFQSSSNSFLDIVTKLFTTTILHKIVEVQIVMNPSYSFTDDAIINDFNLASKSKVVLMRNKQFLNQIIVIGDHSVPQVTSSTSTNNAILTDFLSQFFDNNDLNSKLTQMKAIFEIHPDYEDFISGKKNGKLTRIMDSTECLLELAMTKDDNNLSLNLIANSYLDFLNSYMQFIDELPAEKSFFIPEVYHRPVIGAGGSLIQTIMRKHNVFIQFSNSFLLPQREFSHLRYDNVIIRCPAKNENNIVHARQELNALAQNYGSVQARTLVRLSAGQYRYILKYSPGIVGQIEKNKNVYILFPFEEPASDYCLEIRGNFENSSGAAHALVDSGYGQEMLYVLKTPIEDENQFYNSIIIPFGRVYNIIITMDKNHILLTFSKSNKLLSQCTEKLEEYLSLNELEISEKRQITEFIIDPNHSLQDVAINGNGQIRPNQYQTYIKSQNKDKVIPPEPIQNPSSYIEYPYYRYGYGYGN